jgi:Icc-related predicted phosphoesterase
VRILFTSDLHGILDAYRKFSQVAKDYDAAVIAGDLLGEYIPNEVIGRAPNLSADDFLDDPPSPEDAIEDRWDTWLASPENINARRALEAKEHEIKKLLKEAGRPVLVVPGNHDRTKLENDGNFRNIHLRLRELDGVKFVGYGWFGSDLDPERQMDRFHEVESKIGSSTVLVTHGPPIGTLDVIRGKGNSYRIGSGKLSKAVNRARPLFHLFGHVHGSAGFQGNSVNGSYPVIKYFFGLDTRTRRIWVER